MKNSALIFSISLYKFMIRREVSPPFTPEVSNEEDTKYVPKAYLSAKPEDSIDHSANKHKNIQHFQGFTFNPSNL